MWYPKQSLRSCPIASPNPAAEARLDKELALGSLVAYIYWIVIATDVYFGVAKPMC